MEPATKSRGSMGIKSIIYFHFVFRTYKGRSILTEVQSVGFLYNSFANIAIDKGFEIITCKIMEDHVHCLIGFGEQHRPDYVMRMIKGISAREFFRNFKTNRLEFRKLWGRGYYVEQIQVDEFDNVINYINAQTDRFGVDKRYAFD